MVALQTARPSTKKAASPKSGSARAPATLTIDPPHPDRTSPRQQPFWDFGDIALSAPPTRIASSTSAPPNDSPPRPPTSFPLIQAKLIIGPTGDPFEQEADAAADRVMSMPDAHKLISPPILPQQSLPSTEARLQAADPASSKPTAGAALVHQSLRSPGQPLDHTTRNFFENRFNHDFSHIRIHTGGEAAASARSIGALAYAHGRDLVFAEGKYAPQLSTGRRLLAHELAHTVQQGAATIIRRDPDSHLKFQQELTATDYDAAVLILNGMSDADIDAELKKVSPAIHHELMDAVLRTMFLWNPPRVANALQTANPAESRKSKINFFYNCVNASNWVWAAIVLNGLNDADIQLLLTKPPLTTDQLMQLASNAPWWALIRIKQPINALLGIKAADEMGSMIGPKATWGPSGQGSGTTFEQWASAATEAAAPPLQVSTLINCWEMVLLAAFRAKIISWKWIHDVYTASSATTGGNWGDYLVKQLTPGGRQTYQRHTPTGPQPVRGDIVFWNGAAHVALATGTRDSTGGQQVYSFWPPPGDARGKLSNPDSIKITSIEILADYMDAHPPRLGPVKTLEFGAGPWV